MELRDAHFCIMELLDRDEWRPVGNPEAVALVEDLAAAKMAEWKNGHAILLPDGVSARDDYRELGDYIASL